VRFAPGGTIGDVSEWRQQAFIAAPVEVVWDLLSDVNRHPDWWPKFIAVKCEGLEEGCTYRAVMKAPIGEQTMTINVERLQDCRDLLIRCMDTGTFVRMALTEAQGGTFVDAEAGMDPKDLGHRVFDAVAGKRYFRAWMRETFVALERVASERGAPSPA
jgi:uncharacterized protein YndB with AHSA1/START domain